MTEFIIRDEQIRERAINLIRGLDISNLWQVEVTRHRKKRTLSQNALLHKWFNIIADETGNDQDAVKDAFRDMYLDKVPVTIGDEERLIGRSTTTLNTAEMTEFMNKILAYANSQLAIELPLPEDRHAR